MSVITSLKTEEIAGREIMFTRSKRNLRWYAFEFDKVLKVFIAWSPKDGHESEDAAKAWARENLRPGSLTTPTPWVIQGEL